MVATVRRVEELSPTFRRVTFTGPELHKVADNRLDQRFKILFPTPGANMSSVTVDGDWYPRWREIANDLRPPMRTYTVREVRSGAAEFDVDFALHGRIGPASSWAIDAREGDEVVVCVPHTGFAGDFHGGIDWRPPAAVDRVLIAADETALPAVAGIFERMDPASRGIAVVEVPHANDRAALSSPPDGVELVVVVRGDAPVGALLVPAVREAAARLRDADGRVDQPLEDVDIDEVLLWEVPTDDNGDPLLSRAPLYAWLAGESSPIKTLRRHLVSELGVDRRAVAFMGYWRAGRAEMN